jgi:hypothetical protein
VVTRIAGGDNDLEAPATTMTGSNSNDDAIVVVVRHRRINVGSGLVRSQTKGR